MTTLEMMDSILQYWKDNNAFQRSIDERSEQMQFRFFDGPPFASWDPHYGHLLAWAIKDVFPRYMTMRGFRVERKWWWDCHGLPVEKAVEKKLWIDGKRDIENKIWIKAFTEECRKYVDNTNEVWKWFVDHSGRWADIEHPYRTMDLDFMESVMYCFSNIYRQNLVYKWFKVQRYCPSCATPLANNEVTDGYEDKTDTAITVRFLLSNKAYANRFNYEITPSDEAVNVVCCVIKRDGKYLLEYWVKAQKYVFPGWKVEKWDSIEKTVAKEIREELDVETKNCKILWEFKELLNWNIWNLVYVEAEIEGEPKIMEPDKITQLQWAEIKESENEIWMEVVIDGTVMNDSQEIISQFYDLYVAHNELWSKIQPDAPVYALAWTTTPWTLPSNSFLAVWPEIHYSMVYDKESHEYYILADALLKKFYKNSEDYILVNKVKGSKLVWTFYIPLFEYINNSKLPAEYKDRYFQMIPGDYVSTEDWTGIVHIAPTFWQEDFEVVADLFWADKALDWLFIAVNEYWEFDEQVPDYQWQSVLTVNKEIIDRLKAEKKLIKSESITHSYPHCRRCHTPLLQKAMSSWFIKEQQMNVATISDAEKIRFVPESVSNRFVNWLKQAPDRNVARNRYWGSPLPIWANVDDPLDTFSLSTLEEMYQLTRSWSKNLTKFVFIRHWRTDCNLTRKQDSRGDLAHLIEEWIKQSEDARDQLHDLKWDSDKILVLSPMDRVRETALPTLNDWFTADEVSAIRTKYEDFQAKFREIWDRNEIIEYLQNPENETLYDLWYGVWGDFRDCEFLQISLQWKDEEAWLHVKHPTDTPLFPWDESVDQMVNRTQMMVRKLAETFTTKTVVIISHWDPIWWMRSTFRPLVYARDKAKYYPRNGVINVHYRDNDANTEVNLHKPYVDTYWGMRDGKTYKRIPEVMDCWFESWAMPFGQSHYIGQDLKSTCKLIFLRHWESIFNVKMKDKSFEGYDFWDISNTLTEQGKVDSELIVSKIESVNKNKDTIFYVSLLPRAVETLDPYFEKNYGWKLSTHPIYQETLKRFQKAYESWNFNWKEFTNIQVEGNIFLDARIMEWKCDIRVMKDYAEVANTRGEARKELEERIEDFLNEMKKFAGKQVIASSHYFTILHLKRLFDKQNYQFDQYTKTLEATIKNWELYPFLLPCHEEVKTKLIYPADFIAEGLDQTRGRFRSLHIVGHAIKWINAANNIVVNGLVLAEDGKKMSKSLRNFPDPRGLIEQWWWDAYRIYVLSAPVVRAEPMRFSEKWVEQSFKDYILPLQNVYNFFETYAKIDQWKSDWNQIFAMRDDSEISDYKELVEQLVRVNPDIILTSDNAKWEEVKSLINKYTPKAKDIEIKSADLSDYFSLVKWFEAKRVLILASDDQIKSIWNTISWKADKSLEKWVVLPLVTYQITNDLDAWLLSELHQTLIKEDQLLQAYALDDAIKTTLEFLDKLTNWWLRRSRRRFWANWMDADKNAAYSTLYTVLKTYLQMLAPFIPFITEKLWQNLADFSSEKVDSIHLTYRPMSSELYISRDLMEEIAQVRKIIKLALFVRAKNKVAIKQPLQKLSVKME